MIDKSMYCIYKIKNKINNKVYIGLTNNFDNRMRQHRHGINSSRNHYPLYRSMAKHGLNNFEFIILESNLTKIQAIDREIDLIVEYKSRDDKFGYNIHGGGEIPYLKDESILKRRESRYACGPTKSKNGFKGVYKQSTYGFVINLYGAKSHIKGYRTELEAAFELDIMTIKHKSPGAYLNFPQGKTKEIILEQLISRKALMNRYTCYNPKYDPRKRLWIVRGKDMFTSIVSEIIRTKTFEECEVLLELYKKTYKPIGAHGHKSITAKRSYESLYGQIEDLITPQELEIAYKDLGTFSNEYVDSLFPELEGRDWK